MRETVPAQIESEPRGPLSLWHVELRMEGYSGIHHWEGHAMNSSDATRLARRELYDLASHYMRRNVGQLLDVTVVSVVQVGV